MHAYLALGETVPYRRLYKQIVQDFGDKFDAIMTNRIAWLAALIPDAVETKSGYEEVLRRARKLIDTKNRGSTELRTYGARSSTARGSIREQSAS